MFGKTTESKRISNAINIFTKAQEELEAGIEALKDENTVDANKLQAHEQMLIAAEEKFKAEQAAAAKVLRNIEKIIK